MPAAHPQRRVCTNGAVPRPCPGAHWLGLWKEGNDRKWATGRKEPKGGRSQGQETGQQVLRSSLGDLLGRKLADGTECDSKGTKFGGLRSTAGARDRSDGNGLPGKLPRRQEGNLDCVSKQTDNSARVGSGRECVVSWDAAGPGVHPRTATALKEKKRKKNGK